jgi:hypothetical protein
MLRFARRRERTRRRREGDEERVALRVDLHTIVSPEGVAQHAPVLGQRLPYASASSSSRSGVEPSMSVKRKVTVPRGRSRTPRV